MVATTASAAAPGRDISSSIVSSGQQRSAVAAGEIASRLRRLRELREAVLRRDPALLPELVPRLAELQADEAGAVRKLVAEMIGDIGLQHMEFLPDMIPCLLTFLKDETPAVARQAIKTGTCLFGKVLEQLVIQGLFSSGVDDSLKSSWEWILELKIAVSHMAFQPTGNEGVRLLAVRFVETIVLLYTPDPNISADAPNEATEDMGFNIAWLRGGHPLLNVGDLAMEASQRLGLLLEQLKYPQVKSLSTSMIIVFINSLSAIAQRRPSFYGRILPVLLSLDPASSIIRKVQIPGAFHALKNAFAACLKCTHSSAEPWRARLLEALKVINAGDSAEQTANVGKSFVYPSSKTEPLLPREASTDHHNNQSMVEDMNDALEDDGHCSKRVRQSPAVNAGENNKEAHKGNVESAHTDLPSSRPVAARTGNSEAVHQLVGMFAALAAQGDRAAGSLEILSSSISTDLLAEVVMANMQHLPPACPRVDGEEQLLPSTGQPPSMLSENLPALQPSAVATDGPSLSNPFHLLASLLKRINQNDQVNNQNDKVEVSPTEDSTVMSSGVGDVATTIPASLPVSISSTLPIKENSSSDVPMDLETIESKIPGLDAPSLLSEIQESSEASHTSTEPQGIQEHASSSISTLPAEISLSGHSFAHSSETHTSSFSITEASQAHSLSSNVLTSQYVLPKMLVTNIDLSDEAKDHLQKEAFQRILQSNKQAVAGWLNFHFPLLAHLGIEFPLELDPWELLQKHVLSDYLNHEGHELTLCALNRLYRETEQDQDFLSSRTAMSIYESFLLTVAETVRDMFPASDKSLGRLLSEVPYLPEGILKLLEHLCSPESNEKQDKDLQSGDRVTQGLSAVWSLILLRPSNRDRCLQIALQSAVHPLEEVRMKAIRLVANKLFPMASTSQKIEDFANEKLNSVSEVIPAIESTNVEGFTSGPHKDSDLENSTGHVNDHASENQPVKNGTPSLVADAQRFMSLYFALCTKKHSLLRQVFAIYKSLPEAAKQAVRQHIPILVRTIGSSPDLLGIISDPPAGSRNLLMQVLQTLTEGTIPSQDLISSVKNLYSKTKDVEVLFVVLGSLSKDEVLPVIPSIVNLPLDKFQVALSRILQGPSQSGPCLSPSEVLIAIHGIDPEKEGIPLKNVMAACSACFEQRTVFTQQVLAKALNQLVEQIPLPLLFMRTVIQAVGVFPALVDFVMEIMSRLVNKQIWKNHKLWVGFLKCAIQTKPQSYGVLLQLPAPQLENALTKNPVLRQPLVEHASQPHIRSTLPRSILVVLGLVQDPQTAPPPQPSQTLAAETAPPPQASQTQAAETTPPAQTSQTQSAGTTPPAQTSQTQAAETSSSAADVTTEVTQESTDNS